MKVILLGRRVWSDRASCANVCSIPRWRASSPLGAIRTAQQHEKLHEIVLSDLSDLSAIEGRLSGYDACFFCLGVSAVGMKEEAYRRVTYDLTISVATTLAKAQPDDDVHLRLGRGHR